MSPEAIIPDGNTHPDPEVRAAYIKSRALMPHTREEILAGINDKSHLVRQAWICIPVPLEHDDIRKLLKDASQNVRLWTVSHYVPQYNYVISHKEFVRGIHDTSIEVRAAWARTYSSSFTPNENDINTGINDPAIAVRSEWASRTDFKPTAAQVLIGINDPEAQVRKIWIERKDFTPTPEQFNEGVRYNAKTYRVLWIGRLDCTPTHEQVETGLMDYDENTVLSWLKRPDITKYIRREQFMVLVENGNALIRAMVINRVRHGILNNKMIDQILDCDDLVKIAAMARRKYMLMTQQQINRIMRIEGSFVYTSKDLNLKFEWNEDIKSRTIRSLVARSASRELFLQSLQNKKNNEDQCISEMANVEPAVRLPGRRL